MPEAEAIKKLRPHGAKDWHQLRVLGGSLAVIAIFIAVALYQKHREREDIENNWVSVPATIEEVRYEQSGILDSKMGGAALYRLMVLVKYRNDTGNQERWITLDRPSSSLDSAKFLAFRWKGQQCTVRWKPADPNKVIADIS